MSLQQDNLPTSPSYLRLINHSKKPTGLPPLKMSVVAPQKNQKVQNHLKISFDQTQAQHSFMEDYKMGLMSRVSRTDLIKINNNSRESSSRSKSKERIAAMKLEQQVGVKKKKLEIQKDCSTHQTSLEPPDSPKTKLRKELNLPPAPVSQSVDTDKSPQRFLPNISVKRQFKMSDFDPKNQKFKENPLTIDEDDKNSFLEELESSKNYFDKQRAKFQSIASADLLPEQKFGRLVNINSPQGHKNGLRGDKKQRYFNHKENRAFLDIKSMGQSNQDLKKQLQILKQETLQRKSIENQGSILQLHDQDIAQSDLYNSASRSIMSVRRPDQQNYKGQQSIMDLMKKKKEQISKIIKAKNKASTQDEQQQSWNRSQPVKSFQKSTLQL
ncbi:hypothetical protein FGO68_gene9091 [Halteria grandinella]|uniref:Uncharacterized protein n=1 Tax=Halteria grandinella TaxID=5974 RepID=A0A8J8NM92_HALGN|nr:hypothetical protein FGO68_gene9091 [Halteria grandinella]